MEVEEEKVQLELSQAPKRRSIRMETPATFGYTGQLATDEESYGEKLLFA